MLGTSVWPPSSGGWSPTCRCSAPPSASGRSATRSTATGPVRTRSGAAKLQEAYDDVAATGARTALTLYANEYGPDHCGDGNAELTPLQYSDDDVSPAVRNGVTYVLESYYPTQCDDVFPTDAQVASEMEQLRNLYPHALLGFGEVGLPRPVGPHTLATAERVMSWAYGLDPDVAATSAGTSGGMPARMPSSGRRRCSRRSAPPSIPSGRRWPVRRNGPLRVLGPDRNVAPALTRERLPTPSTPAFLKGHPRDSGHEVELGRPDVAEGRGEGLESPVIDPIVV